MNWDDFRFFLAVAKYKTLKLAGRHLKVDQATVGRRITALQESMGTKLLEKRSNGYFLTTAGSRILESVENIEQTVLSIERIIFGKDEKIEGVIKIAMPGALANQWLIGSLGPFLREHPKLQIDFLTGPEVLNLSRREADIAIRLVRPQQKDLKTRKIGTLKLGLYCAKNFAEAGSMRDFSKIPFIGLYDESTSELEQSFLSSLKFEPQYCMRSAAWSSVYSAVQAGIGIGILPTFIGEKDKTLRLIQEDKNEAPVWLAVHPDVAASARVRATIDYLVKVLSQP